MESVDLTFLKKITKGDETKMKRYIGMYLKHSSILLENMSQALEKEDLQKLALHAHTFKPQAELIGVIGLKETLTIIESKARDGSKIEIPMLLNQAMDICKKARLELNTFL